MRCGLRLQLQVPSEGPWTAPSWFGSVFVPLRSKCGGFFAPLRMTSNSNSKSNSRSLRDDKQEQQRQQQRQKLLCS